jgi:parvulin-like peptidyl-prolyl isomerase
MRTILILMPLAFSTVWYGCAAGSDATPAAAPAPQSAAEPAATVVDARPAALIDGRSVTWGELRAMLSEIGGTQALREVALDRAVERMAAEAGITITPIDLDAERALLRETLHDDPDVALRLLEELRARQGLGPVRFNALMYRNAALRALVRDRVTVSDAAVQNMYDVLHGPRRQARLMVLPTLPAAKQAIDRLENGDFFGDIAVELSTDASATRGGLLEPISRSDASYPEALRSALWNLQIGEYSRPILLNDQYALLMMVREIEGEGVRLEAVRGEMQQRVRRQQERLLMDQLAREIIQNMSVTIFDDSLRESWRMNRGRGG